VRAHLRRFAGDAAADATGGTNVEDGSIDIEVSVA
jgi:hypothetical protein